MQTSPNKTYSEISYTSNTKTIKDPLKDSGSKVKPLIQTIETNVVSHVLKSNLTYVNPILKKPSNYVVSLL